MTEITFETRQFWRTPFADDILLQLAREVYVVPVPDFQAPSTTMSLLQSPRFTRPTYRRVAPTQYAITPSLARFSGHAWTVAVVAYTISACARASGADAISVDQVVKTSTLAKHARGEKRMIDPALVTATTGVLLT